MKKLLVLAFVVCSAVACSKSKPAATTPPQPDSKMEGAGTTEATEGAPTTEEATPEAATPEEATPPEGDPCAGGGDPCAGE